MTRLAVSVEGQTEEAFVNRILAPHLLNFGVYSTPILIGRKGGNVTVERLAADMARLLSSFDRVTSLVDFYGFRDKGDATPDDLEQRILEAIDDKISRTWNQSWVIPYVQLHEFEGLLFSDVTAFGAVNVTNEAVERLRAIRVRFPTPEEINDHRDTAPSKRIAAVMPRYSKVVDGPLIAEAAGLHVIRAQCPRFNEWVTRLESLDNSGQPQ